MRNIIPSAAIGLGIFGGFIGGVASTSLFRAEPVAAQVIPPPSRPEGRQGVREVAAERFVLVDANGTVWGEFRLNGNTPEIALYDKDGRVGWKATIRRTLLPLTGRR